MITSDLIDPAGSAAFDPNPAPPRILAIDDEPMVRRSLGNLLTRAGYSVVTVGDVLSAEGCLQKEAFDVVLSDVHMPGLTGLDLLVWVRAMRPGLPVILFSGDVNLPDAMKALHAGALRYLEKPVDFPVLIAAIRDAVHRSRVAQVSTRAIEHAGATKFMKKPLEIEDAFRRALSSLWMAYQPIVSSSGRSIFAFEALVRTSESALPHPGALFDAAEALGGLVPLGRAIRASVTERLAEQPNTRVFVNLHSRDLLDEALYHSSGLAEHASRVVLEITERSDFAKIPDYRARLKRLRALGFAIAVDDLGAGYAGLTSWTELEPEIVKLDMSLIRNLHQSSTKQALVRALVRICEETKTEVIAEGVENAAERHALLDLGCDLMQGYHFGKPIREMVPVSHIDFS